MKSAAVPPDLFHKEAIEIIAAFTRGNRRAIMNIATMVLEEAYYHEEKAIAANILKRGLA